MFVSGPWLKRGENQFVVLDLLGPEKPTLAGLAKPILNQLRLGRDFSPRSWSFHPSLDGIDPVTSGEFTQGAEPQEVKFSKPAKGRYVCLESVSAYGNAPDAAVAELELLDESGQAINHDGWTVAYTDSESRSGEDGSAENAFDGQTASCWHTSADGSTKNHPHRLILDLGQAKAIAGIRYTAREGTPDTSGRIKEFRVYVGDKIVRK